MTRAPPEDTMAMMVPWRVRNGRVTQGMHGSWMRQHPQPVTIIDHYLFLCIVQQNSAMAPSSLISHLSEKPCWVSPLSPLLVFMDTILSPQDFVSSRSRLVARFAFTHFGRHEISTLWWTNVSPYHLSYQYMNEDWIIFLHS